MSITKITRTKYFCVLLVTLKIIASCVLALVLHKKVNDEMVKFIYIQLLLTRWLYCVECPQCSTRLEARGYLCDRVSGRVQR